MNNQATNETELLALLAEREGILLADSEACGEPLIEQWAARLNVRQVGLIQAFDEAVERYRLQALAHSTDRLIADFDGSLH